MAPKKLYLNSSIEGLDSLSQIPNEINKKTMDQMCKTIKAVEDEAAKRSSEGDEEAAYIMYMKYFSIITIARKRRDCDTKKLKSVVGSTEMLNWRMDKLAELKENLIKRYADKQKIKEKLANDTKPKADENSNVDRPEHDRIISSSPSKFISCNELKLRLDTSQTEMLLVDCRPAEEYANSSISFKNAINIPRNKIALGSSANVLSKSLPAEAQKLWNERGEMQRIILIDWSSSSRMLESGLDTLKNIMDFWDPNTEYKGAIQILDGGYQNFLYAYPMCTTNPKYMPPQSQSHENALGNLDGIEYPSMTDIKMKTDPSKVPSGHGVPRIDRTKKGAVEQKFLHGKSTIEQKEMLVDDILAKDEEVLMISTELTNVLDASNSTDDPVKANELIRKQTELEYKLMQKENELNDTYIELTTVDQLETDKDVTIPTISAQSQPEFTEATARLQAKTMKHTEMERKHQQNTLLIEAKRLAIKEQHKNLQIKDEPEEETVVRPKQPAFDRSMKPVAKTQPIARNFSPEHGSYGDIGASGLKNLGNTCYMNSIIQCLMNIRGLNEYLRSGVYEKSLNRRGSTQGKITEEFAVLCAELWCGRYKSVAPRNFRHAIGQFEKMFSGYEQQDSHEFLTILIDRFHSELQMPISDSNGDEKLHKAEQAWREFLKNRQSIVQHLFFGQIRSTVKCCTCGYESATYEGFSNLSLELPPGSGQFDLFNCFDMYFDGETISGWTCPKCKQVRDAIKKLDISRMPPLLVIHLKRFYMDLNSTMTNFHKKQNYVRFPIREFDVHDYVTRSVKMHGSPTVYNLCAVSNHYGTMDRGHYTAFCKNFKSNSWYKFDDNYVSRMHSHEVNSSASYILFYANQQLGD